MRTAPLLTNRGGGGPSQHPYTLWHPPHETPPAKDGGQPEGGGVWSFTAPPYFMAPPSWNPPC